MKDIAFGITVDKFQQLYIEIAKREFDDEIEIRRQTRITNLASRLGLTEEQVKEIWYE